MAFRSLLSLSPSPLQNDPNMTRQETADLFANIIGMSSSCKHRWGDDDHIELTALASDSLLHAANHAQHLEPGGAGLTLQQQQLQLLATSLADATKTKADELLDQLLADKQQAQQCRKRADATYAESLKQIQEFKQRQEQQQNMFNMISGQMQIDVNNPNCRYAAAAAAAAGQQNQQQQQQQYQQVGIPMNQQQQPMQQQQQQQQIMAKQPDLVPQQPNLTQQQQQQQCYQHSQATQTKCRADGQESGANKRGANGKMDRLQQQQQQQAMPTPYTGDFVSNSALIAHQQQQNQNGATNKNGMVSVVPIPANQVPQQLAMPPQHHHPQKGGVMTTASTTTATTATTTKKSGSRKNKQCLSSRHPPIIDSEFDCNFDDVDLFGQPFAGAVAAQAPNDKSIDVDSETDSNHDTALTLACAGGHDELVKLLLSRQANIEHRDKKGFTPLILAATAGHTKVVEVLLQFGADMEAQSERTKDTPLSLACSGGRYDVVELLLNVGANKEHRNVSDYTPLSLAASGGYVNIIKLLLQKGAEINSRTGSKLGISPLMLAAMNGHTPAVKLLLDMGSDINAQIETNRNTALTLACFQGRHEVVSLLLDRKANVEHRAKTGLTPLMEAASGGYIEVGRVLLDKGADVNAAPVPSSRDTALTIAADKGHQKFVELLLYRGASVEVKNKKGNSPLWLAANGGHLPVVEILYNHDADIDSQDNRKVSCLMAAFRKGHTKVVKWMVNHVAQFPSDQEMTRYISTVSDKELLEKCNECVKVILAAKEAQDLKAYKNASILLEELYLEKTREESRKAAAARRREKKKKKKLEKKEEKRKMFESKPSEDRGDDDDDDSDRCEDEEDDSVPEMLSHQDREEGDSGIDANSQGSCSSAEAKGGKHQQQQASGKEEGGKKSKASKKKEKMQQQQQQLLEKMRKEDSPPIIAPPVATTTTTTPGKAKAVTAEQKKNEKNKEALATNSAAVKKVNANEKENVMPKEPEVATTKGNKSVQAATQAAQKSGEKTNQKVSAQQQQQQQNQEEKRPIVQQANHHHHNKPVEDVSAITLVATTQQANKSNVKANQKVDEQKAKMTVSSHPGGMTAMAATHQHHPQHHYQQQQHQHQTPMKKGDEGWKEVVRKSSSVQQQQQQAQQPGSASSSSSSSEVNCKKIQVPMNAISRVIGRAGSNINAIRASTGAHIEVEKQGKSQSDRLITIKGSAEATKQAHQLIATLIKDPDVDILQVLAKVCSGGGGSGTGSSSGTTTPANVGGSSMISTAATAMPKPVVPTGVSVWGNPPTGPAPRIAQDFPGSGGASSPSLLGKQQQQQQQQTQHLGNKTTMGQFGSHQQKTAPGQGQGPIGKSVPGIVKPTPHVSMNPNQVAGNRSQVGGNNNNNNNGNNLRNGGNVTPAHMKTNAAMENKSVSVGSGSVGGQQNRPRPGMPQMEQSGRSTGHNVTTQGNASSNNNNNKRPIPGSFAAKLQSPAPGQGTDSKNGGAGNSTNVQLSPKHHGSGGGGGGYQQSYHHQQPPHHHHHGHHGSQHHSNAGQQNASSNLNHGGNSSSNNTYQSATSPSASSGYSSSSAIGAGRPGQFSGQSVGGGMADNLTSDLRSISPISQLARNVSPSPSSLLMSSPNVMDLSGTSSSSLGNLGKQLQIQANSAHIYSLFNEAPKWESSTPAQAAPQVDVTKAPGYRVNPTISSPVSSKAGSSQSITPPASQSERGSGGGQQQQQQQQQSATPGGQSSSAGGASTGSSVTGMLGVNVGPIGSGSGAAKGGGGGGSMAVQRPMRSPRYSSVVDPIGPPTGPVPPSSSATAGVGPGNRASSYFDVTVGHNMMNDYGPPQLQSPYQQQQQQQQQGNSGPSGGHNMNVMQNQGRGGLNNNRASSGFSGGNNNNSNNNSGPPQAQNSGGNNKNSFVQQPPPPIGTGGGVGAQNQQQQQSQSMMNQYSNKMNNPYNQHRSGMGQGNASAAQGGGYNRWTDWDGPLSGSSASSSGGGGGGQSGGGNNAAGMMGITNGLAGLGLTGSPSSMSPNKGQQQQQQQQQPPPHHVNGSAGVAGMVVNEEERKMLRAIGTERSWKYGGGFGGGAGPIGPPPTSMGGPMGGQMDADQMSLWMMLKESTGGGGGGNNNMQMPPMPQMPWMSSHNNSNNNNSVNKSRPPPFMPNPEPDLHLQDPYNVSREGEKGSRGEEILICSIISVPNGVPGNAPTATVVLAALPIVVPAGLAAAGIWCRRWSTDV